MLGGFVAFYNSKIKIKVLPINFRSFSLWEQIRITEGKVIQDCIVFYLSVVIGRENLCLPLNQSATKLNQMRPAHRRFLVLYAGCLFLN